jgi:hypothetical protein
MFFQSVDLQWQQSTVSAPLNVRGNFQYVLITNVQFDCYVHLGSATGEIYGELLKGDIGTIRLPTDDISSIVLEAVNPNPAIGSNGVYSGTFATVYLSDIPLRFDVTHKRPPIFSEQNRDSLDGSDATKQPYVYISDDSPVMVAATGLTSSVPGEVVADHETNRYTSRWGSLGQAFLKSYNVGAVGLVGRNPDGSVYLVPTDPVAGLMVDVSGLPAIAFAGAQPVNVMNTPTVNTTISSIPAPTLRQKSYVAGFRNFGSAVAELSTVFAAAGSTIIASLSHDASSTKKLKLQNIKIAVYNVSAAAELVFELRKVNTIPTGGTSIVTQKTGGNYTFPYSLDSEAVAMLNPTGIALANSIAFDWLTWNVTAGISYTNQTPFADLYKIVDGWGESPNIGAGESGGWAVNLISSAAVTVKWGMIMRFTEEA